MAKSTKEITQDQGLQARSDSAPITSPWSPLAEPIFRALWIATVASNIGTWMEDVGESWLMVSLTTSSMLVALVETTTMTAPAKKVTIRARSISGRLVESIVDSFGASRGSG
jgi:Transmembrane secretion effector